MPDSGEATIKTTLTVADEGGSGLNKLEYAWSTSKDEQPKEEEWKTFENGETVSKEDCKAGTYYLWTRVTDIAGNRAEEVKVSNSFEVTKLESPMTVTSKTVKVGEKVDLSTLVSNAKGNVTYSIKNQTTQGSKIEGNTLTAGTNSINDDGDKTIVVTVTDAGNDNYKETSKEVTITVQKYTRTLEWENTTPDTVYYGDTSKKATVKVSGEGGTAGAITYQSSNPTYLTVDASTGTLTPVAVGGASEITAIMARTETVKEASITKTITVQKSLTATAVAEADKIYNGANQKGINGNHVILTGTIEAIDAGTYTATATPEENYTWEDGTTEAKTITWKINPKTIAVIWGDVTNFVYNGKEQAPTATAESGVDGENLNITRTTAITVGNYTSTASLESVTGGRGKTTNYTLTNTTKEFTITNDKIAGNVKITGKNQYGSTLTAQTVVSPEDATLTYQWYFNTTESTTEGTPIEGANEKDYVVGKGLIGKYIYVQVTATKPNYGEATFSDITDPTNNESATVIKVSVEKPTLTGTYTYNGTNQTATLNKFDQATMNVSGNTGIDAGDYTAIISLKDSENYQWSDGTVTELTLDWKINTKSIEAVWGITTTFVYNGEAQAPTVKASSGVSGEMLNLTRTTEVEVGDYTSQAKIESVTGGRAKVSNYTLTNDTKEFHITNAKITGSVTITGKNQYGSTLTAETIVNPEDATLSYQWYSNTTNSTTGGTPIDGANKKDYTVGDGLIGKYIYVVVTAKKTNYGEVSFSDITDSDTNESATVMKANLEKPTVSGTYSYNGTNQKITLNGYDANVMNISGDTGIDAGDYTATVTLKDSSNYQWSDGTIANVTLSWKINPKQIPVIWGETTSFVYNGHPQAPTASAESGVEGETLNITRTTETNVGNYTSTAKLESVTGGREKVSNYTLIGTTKEFSIANQAITGSVKITGTNQYGSTLTAETTVNPSDATLTYQWYSSSNNAASGGTPIDGANKKDYTVGSGLAGKYIYVVVTAKKPNYGNASFSDITDPTNNGSATVMKINVQKPTAEGSYTYNGTTQTLTLKGLDAEKMNVSGNTGIDAGDYTAIVTLKDSENYQWSDGTTSNVTLSWRINPKEVAVVWGTTTSFVYNGKEQAPTVSAESGVNGETLNMTRTTETEVGSYTSTAKLESVTGGREKTANYILTNTTKAFNITNATITGSVTITGTNQYGSTLTAQTNVNPEDATLTYQWYSNTTNSTNGGTPIDGANRKDYTIGDGLVGKYIYVVVTAKKDNYNEVTFSDITDPTNNGSATVMKISIQKPTATGNYTYNGTNQTLTLNGFDAGNMTVSGNTGTDAGNYTATVTLKDSGNYQWSDGTTSNVTLSWKINAKEVAVIWGDTTSFVYNGKEQAPTVSAESGVSGETINITRTTEIDVGSYTSTASITNVTGGRGKTSNYTLTNATKAFNITNATITGSVKITGTNRYGSTLTAQTSVNPGDATLSYQWYSNTSNSTSGGTPINGATGKTYQIGSGLVGKYIYVVVTAKKTNYANATFSDITDGTDNGSATVTKINLNKPTATGNYTYNGATQTLSLNGYNASTMNVSGNTAIDAGNYTATVNLKDSSNYQWSDGSTGNVSLSWKINAKSVAVTWGETTSFVYNGKEQAPTVVATSGVSGETINLTRTTGTNVGSYTSIASITSVTGGRGKASNYTLTNTTKAFTITNATITGSVKITGTNQYGSTLTAETSINPGDATLSYQWYSNTSNSTSGGTPINGATGKTYQIGSGLVGKYIYVVVTAKKANYTNATFSDITDSTNNGSATVTKINVAKPTVSGTYTYNGASQTLSLSGYNSSTMNVSGNTGTDAGNYTATVTLKDSSNYQWSDGTTSGVSLGWKINPKQISVTWGETTSFVYNGKAQAPTVVATSGVSGETINLTRTTGTNVGSYTSTASIESVTGGRGKASNYTLTNTTKAFNITNATITGSVTITGTNQYGSTLTAQTNVNPGDATLSYQWYSNTYNSTSGGTPISGATGKTYTIGNGLVGKYIYVVVTAKKTNYANATFKDITDSTNNGSATVTKINVAKPTASGTYTYNGNTQSLNVSGYNSSTMNISGNTGTDAGNYTATVTLKDSGNYQWSDGSTSSINLSWRISPKSVSVTWGSTTFTYNGKAQGPTASASSGIYGETLNITRTTEIDAGTHTSTASISSVSGGRGKASNYTLTGNTKQFTIARAKTATASAANKTYNGATQTGVTGSQVTWSGTQSAIDAGTYTAKATPTSNYAWSDGTTGAKSISWTINKKSVSVTWGSTTTFTYNGSPQAPTASADSGISRETLNITRTTEVSAGTHTSTASIESVTGGRKKTSNYTLTNARKAFTINKKAIQKTSGDYIGDYDGNSHTITLVVNEPRNGCNIYYSTSSTLTSSNYSTSGTTSKPSRSSAGTTTVYWYIHSTNGNYSDVSGSNTITINDVEPPETADFVKYDVAYTDVYYPEYKYSTTNGWRLLSYTDNQDGTYSNVKLISTGIPAKVAVDMLGSQLNNDWWVTDALGQQELEEALEWPSDWFSYAGDNSLAVSAGLYSNLGDIEFEYGEIQGKERYNKGSYISITNGSNVYDYYYPFMLKGNSLFKNGNVKLNTVTLTNINKARYNIDLSSTDTIQTFEDETGIYRLDQLKNVEGMSNYVYDSSRYLLATPLISDWDPDAVDYVEANGEIFSGTGVTTIFPEGDGIRPVITINSDRVIFNKSADGKYYTMEY